MATKRPLRKINTREQYDAESEGTKDRLFGYGFQLVIDVRTRFMEVLFSVAFLFIFQFLLWATSLSPFWILPWFGLSVFCFFRYARTRYRQDKAIAFFAEHEGIDATDFDLDEVFKKCEFSHSVQTDN